MVDFGSAVAGVVGLTTNLTSPSSDEEFAFVFSRSSSAFLRARSSAAKTRSCRCSSATLRRSGGFPRDFFFGGSFVLRRVSDIGVLTRGFHFEDFLNFFWCQVVSRILGTKFPHYGTRGVCHFGWGVV